MAPLKYPDTISASLIRYRHWRLGLALAGCLALLACGAPPSELQQVQEQVKALQVQVAELEEKLGQVQADQQKILSMLAKQPPPPEPEALALKEGEPAVSPTPALTVAQLLQAKERYLETQVTVKGRLGLVLIHRKSFFLKGPQEQVLVFFGNLADAETVHRLTTQEWPGEIIVTGTFAASDQIREGYQIIAEAVEFQ
ncbi:MAG: hypothetical protein ACLFUU_00840 [Desulfobacteraceae bacterium]